MPIRPRLTIDKACYHITTRGNQRQSIFKVEADYIKYLDFLKKYNRKYHFKLYGYCLMPNHVHLIGVIEETAKLAKFMHGLNRSYTLYFNGKYRKVGHLWQGRFKSRVLNKDEYLVSCINYIELNPVKANIVSSPDRYRWSSYLERTLSSEKHLLDEISF